MLKIGVLVSLMHLAKARNSFIYAGFRVATWLQVYPNFNHIQQFSSIGKCSGQSPESPMNRAFHGFWKQKRAGTKPALVGRGEPKAYQFTKSIFPEQLIRKYKGFGKCVDF